MKTLKSTTAAIQGNDTTYIGYLAQLKALTDSEIQSPAT